MQFEVDDDVVQVLSDINQAMDLLASFSEKKRQPFYEKLESIVHQFHSLREKAKNPDLTGTIPLGLIEYIDKGGNPDDYAKKLVTTIDDVQKVVAVQQKWMKHLKDCIDVLVDLNFPKEAEETKEED